MLKFAARGGDKHGNLAWRYYFRPSGTNAEFEKILPFFQAYGNGFQPV
jgi:hypothetical protein